MDIHTKLDEWRYTTSKTRARNLVKRLRHKSKRRLSKKLLREDLEE